MINNPNLSKNPEVIKKMFSAVSSGYDQANNVLSLGIHHLWRKQLVALAKVKAGDKILDCATGTGDLAIEFKKAVGPTGVVTGTDFCEDMLKYAPIKAQQKDLQINFQVADAMSLPFADNQFDVVSISFGIRNVQDPQKALSEMARVLKPGGRLMVLEFGQPVVPGFSQIYQFYSQTILPVIGGWVTGQKAAYLYLQKSSSEFPCRDQFLQCMDRTGLIEKMDYKTLSGGIAYIYRGHRKP